MVIISESKTKKHRSYGFRQFLYTLTYVGITCLVLVLLNVACSGISQRAFSQNKYTTMESIAQTAAVALQESSPEELPEIVTGCGLSEWQVLVTDAQGTLIYGQGQALPSLLQKAMQGKPAFHWQYAKGISDAAYAMPIDSEYYGCIYISQRDSVEGGLIQTLQHNIFLLTLVLQVSIILFSTLHSVRFSRRLKRILDSIHRMDDGDLSYTVVMEGSDELSLLGREFNYLAERLQTSETKRRQFVSDASHELKTPLASIKLLSDSILQNDMDMETVREFVSDIGQEADRLNRMTLKLLELTKGENDSDSVDAEIIYLAPTIRRVVTMLSALAEKSGITIEMDLKNDAPILIHEDDLYQITFNLVENGIKYNTPGGRLAISLHQQADNTVLRVSDTGVGIPPEAIGHIFERFYRVDKARARQSGGSGLGLAIVRSMVQRNGGEISLTSTLGKGTTFTVEFPTFDTEVDV